MANITEQIEWTLLKDKWPEPGDATLSLIVSTDGEDGPEFSVEDGCTCFEDDADIDPYYPHSYKWFEDANGIGIVGQVHAWTYGPTGKPVIDALTAHLRPQIRTTLPQAAILPYEFDGTDERADVSTL